MSVASIRQLLDVAIGSPEPGHMNFYALHCLLYSFADKLGIFDDKVDCAKYGYEKLRLSSGKSKSEAYLRVVFKRVGPPRLESGHEDPEGDQGETGDTANELMPAEGNDEITTDDGGNAVAEQEDMPPDKSEEVNAEVAAPAEPAAEFKPAVVAEKQPEPVLETPLPFQPPQQEEMQAALQGDSNLLPPEVLQQGVAIMKDQLAITMQQLHKVTRLMIHDTKDPDKTKTIRAFDQKLREIQHENTAIEGTHRFSMTDTSPPVSSASSADAVAAEMVASDMASAKVFEKTAGVASIDHDDLELHLCYSPQKLLDQMLELKSEFCMLSNKVNDLSASVIAQDSNRTRFYIQELQEQVRELKSVSEYTRVQLENDEAKIANNTEMLMNAQARVQKLSEEKSDKTDVAIQLADKVDYRQLQTKASWEQLRDLQCRMEEKSCELEKTMTAKEKNILNKLLEMDDRLGLHRIEELLGNLKKQIDADIHSVRSLLREYIDATNDDCAAAGGRVKVLQDLACFACDATCTMRSREKAAVAKLPTAKATNSITPLVTYELGNIRKSGTVGYVRMDEFPDSPNAWLERQKRSLKSCQPVPRHAGGPHTTHTAKDVVDKVLHTK